MEREFNTLTANHEISRRLFTCPGYITTSYLVPSLFAIFVSYEETTRSITVRGLTANPNAYGPLTNLPDYIFKSGKPTPLGIRQKARMEKQQEYATRIIQLVGEIDSAVERHAKMQEEEKQRRQQILDNKLKPKGDLLLKKQVDKKKS
ncbi:39S ribosomal protein L52, mitochondrial isoform X1 [Harpegnathos saltator]|nr:39S ribosomal protein L52, mitochondrial isoform X1 [Harpegnathos saltator]